MAIDLLGALTYKLPAFGPPLLWHREAYPQMLIRNFIFWLSKKKRVTNAIARRGMRLGFARRFIAGESLEEALAACAELSRGGFPLNLNHLGENVSSKEEAETVCEGYIQMLRALDAAKMDGVISIKPTQLGLDLDRSLCQEFCYQIAEAARSLGRFVEVDMEGTAHTDATLDIYEVTQRRYPGMGVAIQAYLFRSEKDIERLVPLIPKIRLVKGAYREPPSLALQKKGDVDASYRHLADILLDHAAAGRCFPAFASHDPLMVEHATEGAKKRGLPANRFEFQMLYGIRRDLQRQVRERGHTMRVYVPFGTEWVPYFMRRLSERPANVWFVVRSLLAESPRGGQNG
jgi:proline dehydrogenase